jgi:3-oxoadipate enol-lactonase
MFCKTYDGHTLYYEVKGNIKSTETLVFLNGLTQSTAAWMLMQPYFEEKYKMIFLDFIFQGQSDRNAKWRNFDTHARDVKTILEQETIS